MNATRTMPTPEAKSGALQCQACAQPFGWPVAFCPFCGQSQAKAAAPDAAPPPPARAAVAEIQPPLSEPAPPPAVEIGTEKPTASAGRPRPDTSTAGPQIAAPRARGKTGRRGGGALLNLVLVAAILAGLYLGYNKVRSLFARAPTATLTVVVRDPAGRHVETGDVLVNGKSYGAPEHAITVPPGRAEVGHGGDGWQTETKVVTLAENTAQSVALSTKPLPAKLSLTTTPPGADIGVQGRSAGRSPRDITLAPGVYQLTASLDGFSRTTVSVTLGRNEAQRLNLTLVPAAPVLLAPVLRLLPPPFERGVTVAPVPLLASPARNAGATFQLEAGTEVAILGQVTGAEDWLQVRGNAHTGYVPRFGAVSDWDAWARQNAVSGRIDSVQPHYRLVVNDRVLPLFGIQALDMARPAVAWQSRERLVVQGLVNTQVDCVPVTTRAYSCATTEPHNVAELFLENGAAMVAPGATQTYIEAQDHARSRKLGVWAEP